MKCKFCHHDEAHPVDRIPSPHLPQRYTLYGCPACGSRFFDLAEHPVDLEAIYEKLSMGHADRNFSRFKERFYWRRQVGRIRKILGAMPDSVLDVGCRNGEFLEHFPEEVERVGIELSEHSVRNARAKGLTVYQDYAENIDFTEPFHCVTNYALVEHLADPVVFLDRIGRLVRPGGLLVILIPTAQCLKRLYLDNRRGRVWKMYSPPEHLNYLSRRFLDSHLRSRGFTLAGRYYGSGGVVSLPGFLRPLKPLAVGSLMLLDEYTPLSRIPIFDHMYSYYRKTG